MNKTIEYGKFTRITKNFLFGIRYISYYSKKQDQWYLLDLGLNSLWLGFFGLFTPLVFKYIPIKAYPIDEKDIEDVKTNKIFKFTYFIILVLSFVGTIKLFYQNFRSRRAPLGTHIKIENEFLVNHFSISIWLWFICIIISVYIIGLIQPINLGNRKYKKLKVIATFNQEIKRSRIIFKYIFSNFIYIICSISIFFIGDTLIFSSIFLMLSLFSSSYSFTDKNNTYNRKIIFEDMNYGTKC